MVTGAFGSPATGNRDFSNYNNSRSDPKLPYGGFIGFVLASGFDAKVSLGHGGFFFLFFWESFLFLFFSFFFKHPFFSFCLKR